MMPRYLAGAAESGLIVCIVDSSAPHSPYFVTEQQLGVGHERTANGHNLLLST